jgi:hypothetical protein
VALVLSVTSASAVSVYYATDAATAEALGTIASGGTGTFPTGGGLCVPGTTVSGVTCPVIGGSTAGTLSNGLFSVTVPASGYYILALDITGLTGSAGSIWDVTLVNGSSGTSIGTTAVVGISTNGSGIVQTTVAGGGATYTFGITDLLEQYEGKPDTLPGYLNGDGSSDPLNSVTNVSFTGAPFTLTETLTATSAPVPEPASIALLGCGISALGAVRRRRR